MREEILVMITLILVGSMFLAWMITLRYRRRELQHKERLAAIEKGAPLPALTDVQQTVPWTPRVYLLRGMAWLFSGLALVIFFGAMSLTTQRPRPVEERVREAQWVKQMGATDAQVREVQNDTEPRARIPLGMAFMGLVPAGVGLAYLIFYRLEGRNMAVPVERDRTDA